MKGAGAVDPIRILGAGTAGIAATSIGSLRALQGWRGWLDLKREQLLASGSVPNRNEIQALRERVRKLEAITEGTARASRPGDERAGAS